MSKQSLKNTYKFLSLLKENTDKDHAITQHGLRELIGEEKAGEIFGDKGTFTRRLKELANAFNTNENGERLPEDEWQIVYPGYGRSGKNGKIYYNQPLSYFELAFLLEKIDNAVEFTEDEKQSLKRRLTRAASSKYFDENSPNAQAVMIDIDAMKAQEEQGLASKIAKIRDNIIRKRMIEMKVNDNNDTELLRVTPYRIVHKDGFYWMIGNRHAIPREDKPWNYYTEDLFAYRIDLIDQIKTAVTEEETYIHWTMTPYLLPNQSYTRFGGGRETRARYNEHINESLESLLRCNFDVELQHNKKIQTKR
ncbi:MAG: hypothetical protein ACI4EF_04135 [Coprococcus sp.]